MPGKIEIKDAGDARFWVRKGTLDWENVVEYTGGHWAALDHRPTDRWLDAGGHIGTFSVYAARRADHVVAVEPDQDNYSMLLSNLALNDVKNVSAHRAALVGNDDQERPFYLYVQRNMGTHTYFQRGNFARVDVPCVNINTILRDCAINCIEMDVEGAEAELLRAIEDWTPVRQLYLEYHDHILGREGLRDLWALLEEHFDHVFFDANVVHKWWRIVIARKGES